MRAQVRVIHNPAEHVDPSLVGGMVVEIEDGGVRCPGSPCPLGSLFAHLLRRSGAFGAERWEGILLGGSFCAQGSCRGTASEPPLTGAPFVAFLFRVLRGTSFPESRFAPRAFLPGLLSFFITKGFRANGRAWSCA